MSGILIVAEHRRGELRAVTLELVAAAQTAKQSAADTVTVALIGSEPGRLQPSLNVAGVDELLLVRVPVADFDPDTYEAALRELIRQRQPALVLVPHSIDAFGYAAGLAARNDYGFASDVFRVEYRDGALLATRSGYGQKVNVELDFPGRSVVLLTVRGNVYKPPEQPGTPRVATLEVPAVRARTQSRRYIDVPASDDVDMATAEFILSIGRGVGEAANVEQFRELAEAIGATLGCSRPLADAGWLPKSRQIGQSGKTATACKLYVAMGISGAIQHLAGMKHISQIVAVNQDANAAIFSVAHYGIVADIFELAEALREQF
jgi:electron transfer flavoprotein alpha subunit